MNRATWTSRNALTLPDLVPAEQRTAWRAAGHCPGRDLYTLFEERVAAHPERTAVRTGGERIDYAALDACALALAARLHAAGLGPRDVVALNLANGWRAVAAELAVAALGAVALTYPSGTGRADAAALVRTSRAAAVLTDAAVRELLPNPCAAAARGGGRPSDPPDASAPARILTSSGSEAQPKLVAYSHDAMAGGRGNYVAAMFADMPAPRVLMLVQLASSYGSLGVLALVRCGATLLLPAGRFTPESALDAVARLQPDYVCAVPTMLARMTRVPAPLGRDIRALISSGAPLGAGVLADCLDRFDTPVVNVYGSSDGVNCRMRWTRARWAATPDDGRRAARVGRPDPSVVELRLVDEADRPVAHGTAGQILARGPMTPLCHVGRPDLDARCRTADGWVRSGDLGVLEPGGGLLVLDRIKRVVKRGGHSVSPAQLEAAAAGHPAVAEAACVPLPDEDLGQRLCLCLVPRPGAPRPTLAELRAYLETERGLSRRALPDVLAFFPALPLGPTGKVCLKTLSHRAAERADPRILTA